MKKFQNSTRHNHQYLRVRVEPKVYFFWNAAIMAVVCLFSVFIISALLTNSTDKFNLNTSKYIQFKGFFTGNITQTPRFGETMNLNASFSFSRLSFARSRPIVAFVGPVPRLSLIQFGETMKVNHSSAFSCSSLSHCLPFSTGHHLQLSDSIVFFVGADPPLSLDLSAGREQPLAVVFCPFCHFSVIFIATISHIHTGIKFCQTHSQLFPASPGLLLASKWPSMILTGPPFYCRRRTRLNLCILLLLIIGGVEVNPGPSSSPNLTFGMLNTRSVVNKAPLLHSLIAIMTCPSWH